MQINDFNRNIRLLEIAQKGQISPQQKDAAKTETFKNVFNKELAASTRINFSKHAEQRLFSRGISLSDDKLIQLSDAIDKAELKGSKDTLILDDEAAFVASIPNRTIITAFSRTNLQDGVFTSIDSAVIL